MRNSMANPNRPKQDAHIEILAPRFSFSFPFPAPPPSAAATTTVADPPPDKRVPFFAYKSRPKKKKKDTWIVSLFFIFHLVAFVATMFVNNCGAKSHGDCALRSLGRFAFQPLDENPFLGPSASTFDNMGALRKSSFVDQRQTWRLFTSPLLHAGLIHLVINLSSVIYVGIHLEQEFGSARIGLIYILTALCGGLTATLFVRDRPTVASSGALFGLLGTMISTLVRDWNSYTKKFSGIVSLLFMLIVNLILGLLPFVNNFSNLGGLISGFLLGFVLLFSPEVNNVPKHKADLFGYVSKKSFNLKKKFDKPVPRVACLVFFGLILAAGTVAMMHRIDLNKYCSWCDYLDCVPLRKWSCSDKINYCSAMVGGERLTLTCTANDNFKVLPYTNISQARMADLCNLICS